MPPLTPRARRLLFLLGLLYAAVVIPIEIRKGGDLVPELGQSERLLHGERLYGSDNAVQGVWWPPFSALALVPFALLARASLAAAKVAWAILGVACLAWSIARARAPGWAPVALAVAAVAVPIQTNFEHANVNTVLLALIVAAAADLARARDERAGLWIGIATALKAFPGLLIVYLAYRRRWRACGAGLAAAIGLTAVTLLPYGPSGALVSVGDWLALSAQGYELAVPNNQSLAALVGRLGGSQAAAAAASLAALLLVAAGLARRRGAAELPDEVAVVTLLAVLISPIAWVHYYVLLFPAWVAVLVRPAGPEGGWARRAALAVAGVATSGALTIGPRPLRLALLNGSAYAWGALMLLVLFAVRRPPEPLIAREPV